MKLVISDAREGRGKYGDRSPWQRCRAHFRLNAMSYVGVKQRAMLPVAISTAFAQATQDALGTLNRALLPSWLCERFSRASPS